MASADIQFVSNENGEPTAVIVPIELWREIEPERETAYLLKSEAMKARLLAAKQRQDGIPFEAAIEKLGIRSSRFRRSRMVGGAGWRPGTPVDSPDPGTTWTHSRASAA
jgi:hypothetical protein